MCAFANQVQGKRQKEKHGPDQGVGQALDGPRHQVIGKPRPRGKPHPGVKEAYQPKGQGVEHEAGEKAAHKESLPEPLDTF
jgi:hypothetical protein